MKLFGKDVIFQFPYKRPKMRQDAFDSDLFFQIFYAFMILHPPIRGWIHAAAICNQFPLKNNTKYLLFTGRFIETTTSRFVPSWLSNNNFYHQKIHCIVFYSFYFILLLHSHFRRLFLVFFSFCPWKIIVLNLIFFSFLSHSFGVLHVLYAVISLSLIPHVFMQQLLITGLSL